MYLENLGLIGNCQGSALIDSKGAIVWCCLPRFDSEPIFASLLDEAAGGDFVVGNEDGQEGVQAYLENTNVLETTFVSKTGSFRVVDFMPRFLENERPFRPTQIVRMIEPLSGVPRVRVRCAPTLGWSKKVPAQIPETQGIEFQGFTSALRLETDIPVAYLDGQPFSLTRRQIMVLSYGNRTHESLPLLFERYFSETVRYWQRWVKHCNVPAHYQKQVIRSALVLKLHCYEDTGAIVAAMTTSIPEDPGSSRNWDYRYCWLRDAYYTLDAFRLLGHFEERESFTRYLLNIAGGAPDLALSPLYRVDGRSNLQEESLIHWPGFGGHGPVRIGNGAATQPQNDIFGEMVLALSPVFLDERHSAERSASTLKLLERMARKAIDVAGTPDAGIWELRTEWQPQTFSSLMCWAAAKRMARVSARHSTGNESEFADAAAKIRNEIETQAWNNDVGSFVATYGGVDVDASLLQMASLALLPMDDPRLRSTIDTITQKLGQDGWLLRYRVDDGFGKPKVAFTICTFWLAEALAHTGRLEEARVVLSRVQTAMSPLGLISEDYDPVSHRMWGNFPQAYSHVGLIHAAFATAPPWSSIM